MLRQPLLILLLSVLLVNADDVCFPNKNDISCRIDILTEKTLKTLPHNCTVLAGDLVIEMAPELPRKISVLKGLRIIQGGLIIRRTEYSGNFEFLNNIRCIYNKKGPAIKLQENINLHTLGLIKIQKLIGDPAISSMGDSYLFNVEESELRKLIKVASVDGTYREEMITVEESPDDYESTYFFISFTVFSLFVALVIIIGHFVLKIHIPKGDNSGRSSISSVGSSPKTSLMGNQNSAQQQPRSRLSWNRKKPSRRSQQDK